MGTRPTIAWVDRTALLANWAEAKRLADGAEPIAVIKADAYGHGVASAARILDEGGCRQFAVATVAEGRELRGAGFRQPILVLGGAHDPREAAAAAAAELTLVLHRFEQLSDYHSAAAAAGHSLPIQVEVDTGMARMGCPPETLRALLQELTNDAQLRLDGLFTHLARADEPDLDATRAQLRRFSELIQVARELGDLPRQIHVANSAGLMATAKLAEDLPAEINAVRPGLMLYGVYPAPHFASVAPLLPVMTLASEIAQIRTLRAGEPVGYGGTWQASESTRIATVPVGYADGIPWGLANQGTVVVRGRRVPIVGRISMDLITVDVGPPQKGAAEVRDEVLLFGGRRGDVAPPRVEEVAAASGTIAYEVLVGVGARVPRKVCLGTETLEGSR